MKTHIIYLITLVWMTLPILGQDHILEAISPVMTTDKKEGGMKGVWLPTTYGGVTAVKLDLSQIGFANLLKARWKDDEDFKPLYGKHYKLHSDKTTKNELKGTTVRTVILVSEENLEKHGYKDVICYKVHYQEPRVSDKGVPLAGESTNYQITFSSLKDDFEVIYLKRFGNHYPNANQQTSSKPTK